MTINKLPKPINITIENYGKDHYRRYKSKGSRMGIDYPDKF